MISKIRGRNRVILFVMLDVGFTPIGYLTEGEQEYQKFIIQNTQQKVLKILSPEVAKTARLFKYVPAMVIQAEAANLERLVSNELVKGIYESLDSSADDFSDSMSIIDAEYDPQNEKAYTGKGWCVAILDSGVDIQHDFLKPNIQLEACRSTTDDYHIGICPNGQDTQDGPGSAAIPTGNMPGWDHGTQVTGIAAGAYQDDYENTGKPIHGVAPNAGIIAVQVATKDIDYDEEQEAWVPVDCYPEDGEEGCNTYADGDILAGLEYILDLSKTYPIAAVNMSLGNYHCGEILDDGYCQPVINLYNLNETKLYEAMFQVLQNLRSVGVAVVASAGNEEHKDKIKFPACSPDTIAVGAFDMKMEWPLEPYVPDFSCSNEALDLLAPGLGIMTSGYDNQYDPFSGTSASTPFISGTFAVLKEAVPEATISDMLNALKITGIPVTDSANNIKTKFPQVKKAAEYLIKASEDFGQSIKPRIGGGIANRVVTWVETSKKQGPGIYAQLFGNNLSPKPILVRSITEKTLCDDPDAAIDWTHSKFIVVWRECLLEDEDGKQRWRIKARVFKTDGTPLSDVLTVDPSETNQSYPVVANQFKNYGYENGQPLGSLNNWVITWSARILPPMEPFIVIKARGYDSDGQPLTMAGPTLVSSQISLAGNPAIASNVDGTIVITWSQLDLGSSQFNANIFGCILKEDDLQFSAGGEIKSDIFQVNDPNTGNHFHPAVAMPWKSDVFIIAWENDHDLDNRFDINYRIYYPDTDPSPTVKVDSMFGDSRKPSVSMSDGNKSWMIAWEGIKDDTSGFDIGIGRFRLLDDGDVKFHSKSFPEDLNHGHQTRPVLSEYSSLPVIVWQDDTDQDGRYRALKYDVGKNNELVLKDPLWLGE